MWIKIISQQGARETWAILFTLESSNICLKQLDILVCMSFGLRAVMCLVTFCRQHLPGSLKVAHAVSIHHVDVTGF